MTDNIKQTGLLIETNLLRAMSIRDNFESYSKHIDYKKLLPNTAVLLWDYKRYFEEHQDRDHIVVDELYSKFSQEYHVGNSDVDVEYYRDYVFPEVFTNSEFANSESEKCLVTFIKKQLADSILSNIESGIDISEIKKYVDQCEEKIDKICTSLDKDVHTIESEDMDVLDKTDGIPWFLPSLQSSIMSITAGQFIVVSADYGTGKSAFTIAQSVHAFKYISTKENMGPILYFNSEGTASDVLGRFLSNLYKDHVLGGFEEIVDRRVEVRERFLKKYNPDLFKVLQMSDINNFNKLKSKVLKYKPSLIIIDIIDKLAPEEDVINLKKLYDNLRVLAAATCPIIGTTQSGDTSYLDKETNEIKNRKWLGDHSLYGSKSGKGGAADTIITIGREDTNGNLRYIYTPKKKRGEQVKLTCIIEDIYSNYKELEY